MSATMIAPRHLNRKAQHQLRETAPTLIRPKQAPYRV